MAASEERVVRFDNECVLIPHSRSKRPRMSTKSYSLPLWKKKNCPDPEQHHDHVVIKVKVPSFVSKPRSTSGDIQRSKPLSPCLVHRDPSSPTMPVPRSALFAISQPPSTPPAEPRRRTSLPGTSHAVTTIPLRACCTDCYHITEECLRVGDSWKEKFSCGARRRRSNSLDTASSINAARPLTRHPRFASDDTAPLSSAFHSAMTIAVDEVDKRRRSDPAHLWHNYSATAHGHDRLSSSGSTTSSGISTSTGTSTSISTSSAGGSSTIAAQTVKVLRIEEEDEDQLFPLPSPRRSPSVSPTPSPSGSTSQLGATDFGSRDSLTLQHAQAPSSGSDDSHCSGTTRGRSRYQTGLLTPDVSPCIPPCFPSPLRKLSDSVTLESPPTISLSPGTMSRVESSVALPPSPRSPSTSTTSPSSPPSSPRLSPKKRKGSFTALKSSAILRAGADVLKGVSSIGGPGAHGLRM